MESRVVGCCVLNLQRGCAEWQPNSCAWFCFRIFLSGSALSFLANVLALALLALLCISDCSFVPAAICFGDVFSSWL